MSDTIHDPVHLIFAVRFAGNDIVFRIDGQGLLDTEPHGRIFYFHRVPSAAGEPWVFQEAHGEFVVCHQKISSGKRFPVEFMRRAWIALVEGGWNPVDHDKSYAKAVAEREDSF